ncbi:TPA: DUF1700 domain-containing protein [Streptococcus suis]
MTRTEYMAQLEKHLKKLPRKEYQEAITFFNEYFDEAGPDNEDAIMEELGSPKEAASDLINNILDRHIQGEDDQADSDQPINRRPLYMIVGLVLALLLSLFFLFVEQLLGLLGFSLTGIVGAFYLGRNFQEVKEAKKTIWLALLAIFSLPIAIPALLFLVGALIFLILLVLGFILGGFILSVGLFVSGGFLIWEGFSLMPEGFNVFLLGSGSGLAMLGGALIVFLVTLIFTYWAWRLVKTFFQWILKRGKRA